MRAKASRMFLVLFVFLLIPVIALSHGGRTDSSGGHRDNKNASGLGSYHYHHGMGPHLHPGGVCPYDEPVVYDETDETPVSTGYYQYSGEDRKPVAYARYDYEDIARNPSAFLGLPCKFTVRVAQQYGPDSLDANFILAIDGKRQVIYGLASFFKDWTWDGKFSETGITRLIQGDKLDIECTILGETTVESSEGTLPALWVSIKTITLYD